MKNDKILEITCISSKITPVLAQKAMQDLLEAGAVDVYFPAAVYPTQICVLCKPEHETAVLHYLYQAFPAARIYCQTMNRDILDRSFDTIDTPLGTIRRKTSFGYGISRSKAEYEDLAEIARKTGTSVRDIKERIK